MNIPPINLINFNRLKYWKQKMNEDKTEDKYTWPFPTIEHPLTPTNESLKKKKTIDYPDDNDAEDALW